MEGILPRTDPERVAINSHALLMVGTTEKLEWSAVSEERS